MKVSKFKTVLDRIAHLGGYGCSDTERLLFEFVEGELDAETKRKLEIHISDCPPCLEYLDTYQRTIQLTHEHGLPPVQIPPELQAKLQQFIQQNASLK